MRKNLLQSAAGVAIIVLFLCKLACATSTPAAPGRIPPQPNAAEVVPNGTHFLVRLDDELDTGKNQVNRKFRAKTLEPLETSNGYILPPGAKVRGHISRIEHGGLTGRARLWLTFDDIGTHHGRLPLVAEVSSVPGDFSVRPGESKEGEIEARVGKTSQELEAVAAGAARGAVPGVTSHDAKAAATGAAAGGVAGFVASSGVGQEINLLKGTKLDLVLDRPLYLSQ